MKVRRGRETQYIPLQEKFIGGKDPWHAPESAAGGWGRAGTQPDQLPGLRWTNRYPPAGAQK